MEHLLYRSKEMNMHNSMNHSDAALATESQHSNPVTEHPYNLRRALGHFERGYIQNILVLNEWNKVRTAEMLGITRRTLYRKMKKYELC